MMNRKWDLIGAGIFALVLLILLMFMPKTTIANETNTLNDWFEKQYIEFITFQKESWQNGIDQLALNKEQIANLPETITLSVTQTYGDISNLFVSAVDSLNISITGLLNDK